MRRAARGAARTGTSCASPSTTSPATRSIRRLLPLLQRRQRRHGSSHGRVGRAGAARLPRRDARARLRRRARLQRGPSSRRSCSRSTSPEELDPAAVTGDRAASGHLHAHEDGHGGRIDPLSPLEHGVERDLAPDRRPGLEGVSGRLLRRHAPHPPEGQALDADERARLRELSRRSPGPELGSGAAPAAISAHGSPRSSRRPGTVASVQRRGCRSSSPSSSQRQRRRHRGARQRADRVRGDGGLAVGVARDVDEHAPAALLLAPRRREPVRVALDELLGELARAAPAPCRSRARRRSGATTCSPREPDVIANGVEAQLAQQLAQRERARRGSTPKCAPGPRRAGRGRTRAGRACRRRRRARSRRAA